MPYEAMKDRLTTWGRDEAAHQMVLAFGYDMKRLPDHAYEALAPPTLDDCPDSTKGVEDLLEYDLPPRMVTPAPNAAIFEVSRQGTNVAHYVQLSGPVRTSVGSITYTLYRDLVCTCAFPTMLGMPCRHFWRVLRDDAFAAFHLGLVHSQYFLEDPPMHEEMELMSRNVVGKLYHNHERVGPCPVEAPSVEGIVPEGEGEAALLVRQGEVQRIRNRFQLSALAREFVDVALVSQERFEDARFTLRTWIDTQRKPLRDLKADNPAKPPTKAQKRKASEMATGGKKKKKNTAEPDVPPPSVPPPQVYITPPFVPPFVPAYPPMPFANQPIHQEGSDDVVMLRRVPPPSPFTPSLPAPPPSGIALLSQGVHSSQATSSTQSLQPPTLPYSQATPSSQISIPHPYLYTQGSQVPLSMGMQCWPNPGFVPTTDAAYFPLDQILNPAPPAPKKGGGKGKGKGRGKAKK